MNNWHEFDLYLAELAANHDDEADGSCDPTGTSNPEVCECDACSTQRKRKETMDDTHEVSLNHRTEAPRRGGIVFNIDEDTEEILRRSAPVANAGWSDTTDILELPTLNYDATQLLPPRRKGEPPSPELSVNVRPYYYGQSDHGRGKWDDTADILDLSDIR